jgi:hypothetical protein
MNATVLPVNEPESEPAPEERPGSGPGAFTFTGPRKVRTR